jgi:hypothetical protein
MCERVGSQKELVHGLHQLEALDFMGRQQLLIVMPASPHSMVSSVAAGSKRRAAASMRLGVLAVRAASRYSYTGLLTAGLAFPACFAFALLLLFGR